MSANYDIVRNAIATKQVIHAVYQGYKREMCPHVIGKKNGREQALFYQFAGDTSKGAITHDDPKNWRCIPIEGLTEVTSVAGAWRSCENHSRIQTCVDDIDLEVSL